MKSLLSAYKKRISPQKIYIYIDLNICKCIIIGGLTVSSIAMNIAGFPFFFWLHFSFFCMAYFFLFFCLCIIFRMLSLTCGLVALSLFANLMGKVILLVFCHCWHIASSMLDITLALIFSQLPHPECWMPRSHWRLSNGLLCLLGSRSVFVFRGPPFVLDVIRGFIPCEVSVTLWFVQQYRNPCCAVLLSSLLWLKPYWFLAHCLEYSE